MSRELPVASDPISSPTLVSYPQSFSVALRPSLSARCPEGRKRDDQNEVNENSAKKAEANIEQIDRNGEI